MVNARDKGRRGEYQVGQQYLEHMGIRLKRDIEQNVTHQPSWWQQVSKAADAQKLMPVLWYKYDRRDWRVVMRANNVSFALGGTLDHDDMLFTMSADTCFYISREILAARAGL